MNGNAHSVASLIQKHAAGRVLLVTHHNPDGDAIGSAVAMGHIAAHFGCDIRLYLGGGLPRNLEWVNIPWRRVARLAELGDEHPWTPDLVVVTDCGDARRTGPEIAPFFTEHAPATPAFSGWNNTETLNIDHHEGNPFFAACNYVQPWRSATTELLADVAAACGLPLSGALGEAIYLGIVSDSGNFSYSNTTAETLRIAAEIIDAGLDVASFTEQYENQWTVARMNLWGRLMSEARLHDQGRIAAVVATSEMHREFGTTVDDLEGFASWMRRLKGVEVVLFVRNDGEFSKISLRSMGDVNVRAIAAHFGGGGHTAASGAEMPCPPEEACEQVLRLLMEKEPKAGKGSGRF